MTSSPHKKPNRLANATSPYLLQHAYNPVDWFEWGAEAFDKAVREDKPILVSIGYSSCHWCHVMERESFENEEIASLMNSHFVCIKVDREERPDVDQIYMEAVQAMGLNGGWPLNVFLTPSQKPFYGGTYFPPQNWSGLLMQLSKAFQSRRAEINSSADDLSTHLNTSDLSRFAGNGESFNRSDFNSVLTALEEKFDPAFGGLDKAPKFIMPSIWMWLLYYSALTHNEKSLQMVIHTLRQLAMGGIYDQVGGGFSRYSVDNKWFAPHFEKMLYDNAQLLSLFSYAHKFVPDPLFKTVIFETAEWLRREMTHSEGGFYSALDADSEGVEGKFYTWTKEELHEVLGENTEFIAEYFHCTSEGNWEHGRNILYRTDDDTRFVSEYHVNRHDLDIYTASAKIRLLVARNKRIRPGLDDKILTGWNAMTVNGLLGAYETFGDEQFLSSALRAIGFIEANLTAGAKCFRAFKGKRSHTEGFLEDYAFLIQAYLSLYQATFEETWLFKAEKSCLYVISQFWDEGEKYFHFTSHQSEKLIARKKEVFDNVIPSSNSVMARNLIHLSILLDHPEWKQRAVQMVSSLKKIIVTEPAYTSNWGIASLEITFPVAEIAIVGSDAIELRKQLVRKNKLPSLYAGTQNGSSLPLLIDKPAKETTFIYVCFDRTCKLPVTSVNEALDQLNAGAILR